MTEALVACSGQPLVITGSAVPDIIHLMPMGTFTGRDGRGPYTVRDKEHAAQIIANSRAYQKGADTPVDYEHGTVLAAPKGQQAPAAGWLKSLEVGPNGIWGKVEWTAHASQKIGSREYRYISPAFTHGPDGAVMRIASAALVNTPNLELTSLNSQQGATMNPDTLASAKALLGLAGGDDPTFIKTIGDMSKLADAFRRVLDLPPDTPASGILDALMTKVGAGNGEAQETAAARIAGALATGVAVIPRGYVPMAALEEITAHASQLQERLTGAAVEKAVHAALVQGRLSPAMVTWASALAASDPQAFDEFTKKMPPMFAYLTKSPFEGRATPSATGPHAHGLTDQQLAVCRQVNVSPESYAKNLKE